MSDKLDRVCDQLRIKLHRIDRRLEALKGNAMALSEKSESPVERQLDRIEQRIYDGRIRVDAANTRVKTWLDGKKAGLDASRDLWEKERRFHQLTNRADDTEAYAIAVFELAAAAADAIGAAGAAPTTSSSVISSGAPKPKGGQTCPKATAERRSQSRTSRSPPATPRSPRLRADSRRRHSLI